MKYKTDDEQLQQLYSLIRNTMSEAIGVIELAGSQMLEIKKNPDHLSYLTKLRMDILHLKNKLKEVYDLMGAVLKE